MGRFTGSGMGGALLVCLLLGLTACGSGGNKSGAGPVGATVSLLPAEKLPEEMSAEGQAQHYQGRELFDYIDGGADLYLEFGLVDVAVRDYQSPEGKTVTAAVYRMENPDAAFGIFSVTRSGDFRPVQLGAMGARSEFENIFCHGDYFVQVQSTGKDSVSARAVDQISAKIDSELAGASTGWPKLLDLLPKRRLVPHSEVYIEGPLALNSRHFISDENLLELSDSIPGAMASVMVQNGGHPALYLVVEYPDSAFSRRVFDKLQEFYSNTADQERGQDANVQFKPGDNRIVYSNTRQMDALVLQGVHLTAMFENIGIGHGVNPHGGGADMMMNPHGGGSSSMESVPNPHETN